MDYLIHNFKIQIKLYFAYLQEYIMMLLMSITFVFIQYALVSNIYYTNNAVINGFTKTGVFQYFVLSFFISQTIFTEINYALKADYRKGTLIFIHSRPVNPILHYFVGNFSNFFGNFISKGLPIIVITTVFMGFRMNIALFLLMMADIILIYILNMAIYYIIGMISIMDAKGPIIEGLYSAVFMLFSGSLLPMSFFPKWMERLSAFLPFEYILYRPIKVFISPFSMNDFLKMVLIQVIWLAIAVWIISIIQKKTGERMYVNG